MFRVSCLGIWWRHDIWISKKLKLDYLKNEKSFWSEINFFFLVSQVLFFRHTKQTNKNVADTTLKLTTFPWWTKGSRETAIDGPTVLYTDLDMTKIIHARSYVRFIKIQSNFWRKKLHRTNEGSNFLEGNWDNIRAPIKFRGERQVRDPKRWLLLMNRPSHFNIIVPGILDWSNKTSSVFPALKPKATSCPSPQCLVGQKLTLVVATN